MTNASDRRPFSMPYVNQTNSVTAGTATMIARAPWPQPVGKYFVLRKLVATINPGAGAVSGGLLSVWDQDLSNTTPISRGSAGGPLFTVPLIPAQLSSGNGVTAPSMTILDIDACPQQIFQAGLTIQTALSGISTISFEADVI